MNKGERELRKMLKHYPEATLVSRGRPGYVLSMGGRTMHLGGLSSDLPDRRKIERFLGGKAT